MNISELLAEGLITSIPISALAPKLQASLGTDISVRRPQASIISITALPHTLSKAAYDKLLSTLSVAGWFISSIMITDLTTDDSLAYKDWQYDQSIADTHRIDLFLEPKYDAPVRVPRYLYHATPAGNLEKITRTGLVPRAGMKRATHPDRVYLAVSIEDVHDIIDDFRADGTEGEFALLTIDTKLLPSGMQFYRDSNFMNSDLEQPSGAYTTKNIPPSAIVNVARL